MNFKKLLCKKMAHSKEKIPQWVKERYDSSIYECDVKNVKNVLDRYGVAIIPNLINDMECEAMISGMWDFLEEITQNMKIPIMRNKPETYKTFYELYPLHSMLIQRWGVGQAQFQWDLRTNEKIINVFKEIWLTDKLAVSFDGASFHFPPEKTGKGFLEKVKNQWLHTDQSYTRNGIECIQSWITAYPVNIGDATLTFLEKSHLYHGDFTEHFTITDKKNWYKLNEKEMQFYINKGCKQKSIACPKGSLVLWDSRTIHAGQEAMQCREHENIRFITYLCYTPIEDIPEKILKKRREAVNNLRTTSHWPKYAKLFPTTPHTYGNPLPNIHPITPPKINSVGQQLIDGK